MAKIKDTGKHKVTFGKKKRVAKKSFNKHDSRSSYHRKNASR